MQQVTFIDGPLIGQVRDINLPPHVHCSGHATILTISLFVSEIQYPVDLWTHSIAFYSVVKNEAYYKEATKEIHAHPYKAGHACICTIEPGY